MYKQVARILFTVLLVSWMVAAAFGQTNLSAKANSLQPAAAGNESDRLRDGLQGPVRRIRTEGVKLSTQGGKTLEDGKRVVLETAEYDLKGSKTQNQYFPVVGSSLTGREVYKYDDKGNISEMTFVNADGSLVSREVKPAATPGHSETRAEGEKVVATQPLPTSSLDNLKLSAAQPGSADLRGAVLDTNKKVVVVSDNAPPPAPRPLLKPVSGGVLNGMALALPPPSYPDTARRMRQSGLVQVEFVVDENGKVISARALSGPSTLRDVAVEAAYRARFSPTKLSGQPVKVTGQINYNFTLPLVI